MATVPTAPNIVSLPRAQDGSIEFWWNPPTSDGGSALTGYTVSCSSPQLQVVLPTSAYNTWVQGLTNGQNYTFFITASNAVGESEPATWQPYQPGFVPSPPTGVVASQQGTSCNLEVSRSIPVSTNTVNYWSVEAVPADVGFSTIVQADYGSNLTTVIPNLNMNETQWQVTARQLTDPGWSEPSAKTAYIGNNRVRSAFVTNISGIDKPTFDSNGNYWAIMTLQVSSRSTFLYDSRGTLRQGFGPAPGNPPRGAIVYVSADGVTDLWMAPYVGVTTGSAFDTNAGFIDSSGNFMTCFTFGGSSYVEFRDRNDTQMFSNATPLGAYRPYFLKFSPTGVYNGTSDVNTWISYVSSPINLNVVNRVTTFDTSGNIFASFQVPNSSGGATTKFTTVLDRTGAAIGTTISHNYVSGYCLLVKMANNGLATNSWRAFWSNSGAAVAGVSAICVYPETFKINRQNQLVAGIRYTGANSYLYDKNDATIGSVIPYQSTIGIANFNTLLVRMGVDGTAASSWRASIGSEAIGYTNNYRDESPVSIQIDVSNNILLTGFSEFGPTYANTIPLDSSDASNVSVTQSTFSCFNLFTTRYTNTGTPNWLTTIQGVSSAAIFQSTIINTQAGNSATNSQFTKTVLDSENNLFIAGNYNSNALNLYDKNGSILKTLSSPLSNFQTFIAKINPDGTSGTMARIGAASTVNAFATRNWHLQINSSNNVCVAGQFATNLLGFYPSSNDVTPNVQISSFTASAITSNLYVAQIDNGLNTISMGRLQLSSSAIAVTIDPFHFKTDGTGNLYTFGDLASEGLTTHMFALGNHTNVENKTIIAKESLVGINPGVTTVLSKFTSNTDTLWTSIQTPGNIGTPNNVNSVGLLAFPNLIINGNLYINSNSRIFASMQSSTIQSTILYDKNFSTVTAFQQTSGFSVNASTIGAMMSYPSDGINRLQ